MGCRPPDSFFFQIHKSQISLDINLAAVNGLDRTFGLGQKFRDFDRIKSGRVPDSTFLNMVHLSDAYFIHRIADTEDLYRQL